MIDPKSSHPLRIGIVGAGWNGCHLALELKKEGHHVSLFERNSDIFQGVSGNFGIRLHKGPHYPRSKATRDSCREAFEKFCQAYPDLVVPHEHAVYAQGEKDALGNPSKVSAGAFRDVCYESPECVSVDTDAMGFSGLVSAFDLDEPSVAIGERVRGAFKEKLGRAFIYLHLNTTVEKVINCGDISRILTGDADYTFDIIINATAYESLLPRNIADALPVDIEVTYQTCIALVYEDQTPQQKPFSFIVMDGWFPCVMPAIQDHDIVQRKYIVTHGSYTILGSFDNHADGQKLLSRLSDEEISAHIKPYVEKEISRFWPVFLDRFKFCGWKGSVIAKLKTTSEFRSSLTYEKDGVIHVFPGKVSNVVTAAEEVIPLIDDIMRRRMSPVVDINGVRFTISSAFATYSHEIRDKPALGENHTSNLQTYASLVSAI